MKICIVMFYDDNIVMIGIVDQSGKHCNYSAFSIMPNKYRYQYFPSEYKYIFELCRFLIKKINFLVIIMIPYFDLPYGIVEYLLYCFKHIEKI